MGCRAPGGWLAGVAALIAAGAVAAALVVAGGTGQPRLYRLPGVVAAAPAGAATARQVLLTAARNVARNTPPAAPAATGCRPGRSGITSV